MDAVGPLIKLEEKIDFVSVNHTYDIFLLILFLTP